MLRVVLIVLFALAMTMATGPGVLLVNRPATVFGIPAVYAWGVGWYFVLVAIALVASRRYWRVSAKRLAETVEDRERGESS